MIWCVDQETVSSCILIRRNICSFDQSCTQNGLIVKTKQKMKLLPLLSEPPMPISRPPVCAVVRESHGEKGEIGRSLGTSVLYG